MADDETVQTTTSAPTPEDFLSELADKITSSDSASEDTLQLCRQYVRVFIVTLTDIYGGQSPTAADIDFLAATITGTLSTRDPALASVIKDEVFGIIAGRTGDYPDSPQANQHAAAEPVMMATGQFTHECDDFIIRGAGIDFVFRRTYRNQVVHFGRLGANWDHHYNIRLREGATRLEVMTGELTELLYSRHPRFGEADFTYYVPPDGEHTVIRPSGESFVRAAPDGVRMIFERDPERLDSHRLARIEDRFGNFLGFVYVENRLERVYINRPDRIVEFHYDDRDRIDAIEDFTGRRWQYDYDDWNDLVGFTTPATDRYPLGLTTVYEYSSASASGRLQHNLTRIIDPSGCVYVENEYGGRIGDSSFNRVVRQRQGRGEYTFEYEIVDQIFDYEYSDSQRPAFQTNFLDRNGHPIHYLYNKFGNLLLKEEEIVHGGQLDRLKTRYRYNRDGALGASLSPEGVLTQYYFGRNAYLEKHGIEDADVPAHLELTWQERLAFGRQIAVLRRATRQTISSMNLAVGVWGDIFPDILGALDPADIVTKYSYEPDYGQVLTVSDPRFTERADPNFVESAAYTATLTRYEYTGPIGDPHQLLDRIVYPEPTWPDGTKPGPVVERFPDYDDHGRLRRHIDPNGGISEFHYFLPTDGIREGYLRQQIVDPGGISITTEYEVDELGRTVAIHEPRAVAAPAGRFVTRFAYNAQDQLVESTASPPFNYITRRFYDANGLLERQERDAKDESGADLPGAPEMRRFVYDDQLNLLAASIGGTNLDTHLIVRYCYDGSDKSVATTLPNGNRIRRRHDERLQEVEITWGAGTPDAATIRKDYDGDGRLRRWVSARGVATEFALDVFGRLVEKRDALGHRARYTYDRAGNLITERLFERQGDGAYTLVARTEFEYDVLNRRTRVGRNVFEDPLPVGNLEVDFLASPGPGRLLITQAYYDANSRMSRLVDPLGRTHARHYDAADRLRKEEDPAANHISYSYDAQGNPIRCDRHEVVRDPKTGIVLGELVFAESRSYDELGRLESVTDSLGNSSTCIYDSRSNLTKTVDPLGNVHRVQFDIYGRLIVDVVEMTDTGLGVGVSLAAHVTRYGFDANSNPTSMIDPLGRQTLQKFDALDRCRHIVYPNLSTLDFEYDGDGNVTLIRDNNGVVRKKTINAMGQVTRIDIDRVGLPATIIVEGANAEVYEYDGLGRLRTQENDFARLEIVRNSLGWARLETETFTTVEAPTPGAFSLQRTFDDMGACTGIIYPEGREIRYTRNAVGQITQIDNLTAGLSYPGSPETPDQHPIAAFEYRGLQRSLARWGNGATTSWNYDGANRAIQIQHFTAGQLPILGLQQLFDAAGNMRSRDDLTSAGNAGEVYRFNSAYWLTGVGARPDPPVVDPQVLAPATTAPGDPLPNRQADIDALIRPFAQVPGAFVWNYDDVGNRRDEYPAAAPAITYDVNDVDQYSAVNGEERQYDPNGNLISDTHRTYCYDSLDRLVRVVDTKTGGVTRFFHDAAGRRILQIEGGTSTHFLYDGANVVAEYRDGKPFAQFVHEGEVDTPVVIAANKAEHFYHKDLIGSVRSLTDRSGDPVGDYHYSPFGLMLSGGGPYNPIGYASARWNAAIESYDCRARQYEPRVGRFLQRDRAGLTGDTNLYTYCGNNPLCYRDPLGLERETADSSARPLTPSLPSQLVPADAGLAANPQTEPGSQPPTAGQQPARHGPTRLGQQAPSGPSQVFRTTTYHKVMASPGNVPILDPHGRELGRVSPRSFADLAQEGNGQLPDGTFVNVDGLPVVANANTYRPVLETAHGAYRNARPNTVGIRLNNPRDWGGDIDLNTDQVTRVQPFKRDNAAGEWGRGAFGRPLVPYRSIAVDPRVVPRGTRVYIRELVGMRLPDGSTHDGWVTADDKGGSIKGLHFDIFTGTPTNLPDYMHVIIPPR